MSWWTKVLESKPLAGLEWPFRWVGKYLQEPERTPAVFGSSASKHQAVLQDFFGVLSLKSQFTFSPSQQKICVILLWKVRTLHQFLSSVRGTPAVFPLKVLCVKIQSKKVTIYNCVWMKDSVFVVIFSFSHCDNFQLSNLLLPAKRKVTLGNRT